MAEQIGGIAFWGLVAGGALLAAGLFLEIRWMVRMSAGFAAVVAGVLLAAGRVVCKEIFGGILTWGFLLVLVLLLLYALIRQRS